MGCMLYGAVYSCMLIQRCIWRCMAVWRRGEGVTRRVCCMERHTAKYSEIQPNSIQPAIQPCRVHAAAAARGLDVLKPQYMLPWLLGIAQHLQKKKDTEGGEEKKRAGCFFAL